MASWEHLPRPLFNVIYGSPRLEIPVSLVRFESDLHHHHEQVVTWVFFASRKTFPAQSLTQTLCLLFWKNTHTQHKRLKKEREKMKYVLVTGGVVSGLGKGVTASSIGVVLKACGLRITSIKIGPLLFTHHFYVAISFVFGLLLLIFMFGNVSYWKLP